MRRPGPRSTSSSSTPRAARTPRCPTGVCPAGRSTPARRCRGPRQPTAPCRRPAAAGCCCSTTTTRWTPTTSPGCAAPCSRNPARASHTPACAWSTPTATTAARWTGRSTPWPCGRPTVWPSTQCCSSARCWTMACGLTSPSTCTRTGTSGSSCRAASASCTCPASAPPTGWWGSRAPRRRMTNTPARACVSRSIESGCRCCRPMSWRCCRRGASTRAATSRKACGSCTPPASAWNRCTKKPTRCAAAWPAWWRTPRRCAGSWRCRRPTMPAACRPSATSWRAATKPRLRPPTGHAGPKRRRTPRKRTCNSRCRAMPSWSRATWPSPGRCRGASRSRCAACAGWPTDGRAWAWPGRCGAACR